MTKAAALACLLLWAAAWQLSGGATDGPVRLAEALARPLALPFLWRSLAEADRQGDAVEAYGKAQQLLLATPGWADGHTVFAFRYALDADLVAAAPQERARLAKDRLLLALATLDDASRTCGPREHEVLAAMAWLVELAVRNEPGIAALLPQDPALLAEGYLRRAEERGAGRMVRERRLYELPRLCAIFLGAGDRRRALDALDEGVARCRASDDPGLAEWADRLAQIRSALADGEGQAVEALAEDPRLEPLVPFLRQRR